MNLKPYPDYKDSGVQWLGDVPKHWEIVPGMAVISEKQVKNTGMKENTVLSLSYGRIVIKSQDKLHGLVPESFETYQTVEPGDIIIRSTDLQNDWTSLRVGKVKNKGIITSAYLCLKTKGNLNGKFAYLLLHGFDLMKVFYGMGSGLRQNLSWIDFKRMPIAIPIEAEQLTIARFLDYKTAQIARFIKAKKRMIELLKEQKQVIINDAVTGKIVIKDEGGRLKAEKRPDSSFIPQPSSFLQKVPEGWEVLPLRRCSKMVKTGGTPSEATDNHFAEDGFNWYTPGDFVEDIYLIRSSRRLSPLGKENVNIFPPNTIMMIGIGATIGKVSISKDYSSCNQQINAILPNEKINIEYLTFYLRLLRTYILACGKFTTLPIINQDETKSLPILVPHIEEQLAITIYIETQTAAIDLTISRTEREIALMQEYRTRLVSDVVTGKVDVRDIEIPGIADIDVTIDESIDELEGEEELETTGGKNNDN